MFVRRSLSALGVERRVLLAASQLSSGNTASRRFDSAARVCDWSMSLVGMLRGKLGKYYIRRVGCQALTSRDLLDLILTLGELRGIRRIVSHEEQKANGGGDEFQDIVEEIDV